MLFKVHLFCQCAGSGTFWSPNSSTLKWVSFLFGYPWLRVERWEQGREGPSEIPLCVGLESFCLCELNIKRSCAAAGSLKWQKGGIRAEYRSLPRHVPVQNRLCRSVKTAQLKVFWEWHKIKAKDLSLSHYSWHIMKDLQTHYSVILHTVFVSSSLTPLLKARISDFL